MTKNKLITYGLVLLVAAVAAYVLIVYFGFPGAKPSALSHQDNKTLVGTVLAVNTPNSMVIMAQQGGLLGTTTIAIGSTTIVVKNTPLSPEEMQAAFKEFQKLQAAAQGKDFAAPSGVKVESLPIAELKGGDTVLVTLTATSTKDHFEAIRIEVLPVGTQAQAMPIPTTTSPASMPATH